MYDFYLKVKEFAVSPVDDVGERTRGVEGKGGGACAGEGGGRRGWGGFVQGQVRGARGAQAGGEENLVARSFREVRNGGG